MTDIDLLTSLLNRRKALAAARTDVVEFAKFMMPTPEAPDDVTKSQYQPQRYHRVIGAALEEVELGNYRRLAVSLAPRHGKTTLVSHVYPAWYLGRHPDRSIIVSTYNEKFAWDFGRRVRSLVAHPLYRQVFPGVTIKKGAASVDRLELDTGGIAFFLGRGSSAVGRGAHLILLDDPIKDAREGDSPTIRENLWVWFNRVLRSRLMTKDGAIILITTRWNEDDLIGRLTDPLNPYFALEEAKLWNKVDLPALADDGDILGRAPGEALWPERFDEKYLAEIRASDPRGFEALYQGRPAPREGAFFRLDHLNTYSQMKDLPPMESMRFYAASDHAVALAQRNDKTCLMVVGVDEQDDIWVMPDLVWARIPTDATIEAMLVLIEKYAPQFWWAERDKITKSIGPFLQKRMIEKRVFCAVDQIVPAVDKQQRAQPMQARMAMGKVHFPSFSRWWSEAQDQILKFPHGAKDDFVDALSLVGMGLVKMRPRRGVITQPTQAKPGTFREMLGQTRENETKTRIQKALQGWQ